MPTLVQHRSSTADTVTSAALAYSSNVTKNNLLIAITAGGTAAAGTSAVTDSQGNSWTKAASAVSIDSNANIQIWYAVAGSTGANTVTNTTGLSGTIDLIIAEYSGLTVTPLDQSAGHNESATTSLITTTQASELVVAAVVASTGGPALGTWSASNSFTIEDSVNESNNVYGVALADLVVSSVGSYSTAFTNTGGISGTVDGGAVIASFNAAPTGPPPIQTLRFEIPKKRWFSHAYADTIVTHYLDELDQFSATPPPQQQLLSLSSALGFVYLNGGNTDNGTDITTKFISPSLDGGDDRIQKLYVDVMSDADGTGTVTETALFNNQTVTGPSTTFSPAGVRAQFLDNISSLSSLTLYRDIALQYQWVGGPAGPRLYICEPTGYAQPYVSTFFVTQFINLAFPGWKHHRRLYAGYISNNTVAFTIKTQDGRTYGPYTLPSTSGQFKIVPFMLDQAIKDLAFAYQLDGSGNNFVLFTDSFTIETKEWTEPSYIPLAIFRT